MTNRISIEPNGQRYRVSFAGHKRVYRSPRYMAWITEAGLELNRQRPAPFPVGTSIALRIKVGATGRRRDIDNVPKAIGDLLQAHGIFENDAAVANLTVTRDQDITPGRVEIEASTIADNPRRPETMPKKPANPKDGTKPSEPRSMSTKPRAKPKSTAPRKPGISKAAIKAKADRAEARSKGIDPDTVEMPKPAYDPLDPPESKPTPKVPVRYSEAIAEIILERLRNGETLNAVCKGKEMPSEASVREWAAGDTPFASQYARAREIGYMKMADQVLEIADEACADATEAQRNRLRVDTRKWLLSKALPKIYGDRLEVNQKVGIIIVKLSDEDLAL